ncbi:MAG: S1C family serine protease [Acutalibacteraceae bacterium]
MNNNLHNIPRTIEEYEKVMKNKRKEALALMDENEKQETNENGQNKSPDLDYGDFDISAEHEKDDYGNDKTDTTTESKNQDDTAVYGNEQQADHAIHYQQYRPQHQPPMYQQQYQAPPYQQQYQQPYCQPQYQQAQQQTVFNNPQYPPYQPMPYPPYNAVQNKQKLSTGAKWLIGLLIALLVLSLIGYFIFLGGQLNNKQQNLLDQLLPSTEPTTAVFSQEPTTVPSEDGTTPQQNSHTTGEYCDKTFKGLTLADLPKDKTNTQKYTTQSVYNSVSHSIVAVMCYKGDVPTDGSLKTLASQGTGIIITDTGYIVTNSHVIGNTKSLKIQIVTNDGTKHEANVVGYDTRTDLAVLKTDAKNLKPAVFGNSDEVEVGQDVIALGNPGGIDFQNSLTKGIISAKDRTVSANSTVKYLQTDAAINPGNSGGPLCNIYGQVIGINTVKIVSTQYEGMGFSIPSNTVKQIVDDIIKQGYVNGRVRIGITGTAVTKSVQDGYNIPSGIVIYSIDTDGPLAGKDVKVGDIITSVDGKKVSSFAEVYSILSTHNAGDEIEISFYRMASSVAEKDKEFKLKITLAEDNGETQE